LFFFDWKNATEDNHGLPKHQLELADFDDNYGTDEYLKNMVTALHFL